MQKPRRGFANERRPVPNSAASRERLFANRIVILCDQADSAPDALATAERLFTTGLGMRLIHMDAARHDLNAAYISHLPHVLSYALALATLDPSNSNVRAGAVADQQVLAPSIPSNSNVRASAVADQQVLETASSPRVLPRAGGAVRAAVIFARMIHCQFGSIDQLSCPCRSNKRNPRRSSPAQAPRRGTIKMRAALGTIAEVGVGTAGRHPRGDANHRADAVWRL